MQTSCYNQLSKRLIYAQLFQSQRAGFQTAIKFGKAPLRY